MHPAVETAPALPPRDDQPRSTTAVLERRRADSGGGETARVLSAAVVLADEPTAAGAPVPLRSLLGAVLFLHITGRPHDVSRLHSAL